MMEHLKPIRRVVTGSDERGKSKVIWDGIAANVHQNPGTPSGYTDIWAWDRTPALLSGRSDDGDMKYEFPCPTGGGHMRVIQSRGRPAEYDPSQDAILVPPHEPKMRPAGRTWDRGGKNAFSSDMHKTESIDYAILVEGERILGLDDGDLSMRPGDVLIQVGAWHRWSSPRQHGLMVFDMFAARFVDGPAGLAQGNDAVLRSDPAMTLPSGVKPVRRIVTIDRVAGKSCLVSDGPSPDVRFDPARPGYALTRMWVTDSAPAKISCETLHLPHTLEPPPQGSVLRVITVPPDANWRGKVGAAEVRAYFAAMGSPGASTYSAQSPHPYMQKTDTLDLCAVVEGEVVLVLDTQEVTLKAGELVVLRGDNHAWSNRSGKPAQIAVASHDGTAQS